MDAWKLDVTTGVVSLAVFIVALITLPKAPIPGGAGMGYVLAIVAYIILMSGTGLMIREKIA